MKILVVEDEVQLADTLAEILKRNKYNVDTVFDGDDGLEYARTGIYDCILLDIMLPVRSGTEIVQILRQEKNATPIMLLTAKSEVEDKIHGLDCGADDYLTKPFSTGELLARIRALTRRKGEVEVDCLHFAELQLNRQTYDLIQGENRMKLSLNIRSWKCCCPTPNRSFPRNALSKRSGAMKAMSNITISRCISPSCEKN